MGLKEQPWCQLAGGQGHGRLARASVSVLLFFNKTGIKLMCKLLIIYPHLTVGLWVSSVVISFLLYK